MPLKKACNVCKNIFLVKSSHFNKRTTCSRMCMANLYKTTLLGKNNPNFRNINSKKCIKCNQNFFSYNKKRKFCSMSCYKPKNPNVKKLKKIIRIWTCKDCSIQVKRKKARCDPCRNMRGRINVECSGCSKKYITRKTSIRGIRFFCSNSCRMKNMNGKYNPNWKHGLNPLPTMIRNSLKNKELKIVILKRDKYSCIQCHQVGGKLHVDHKKKFSIIFDEFLKNTKETDKYKLFTYAMEYPDFWDESNLQVLCKKCNWNKELEFRKKNKNNRCIAFA